MHGDGDFLMNCHFYAIDGGVRCRRCGQMLITADPPERCHAACPAATGECRHFGEETRRVGCESCGGNVQIKVFACAAKGECTLGQPIEGIACCATCEGFEAAGCPTKKAPAG